MVISEAHRVASRRIYCGYALKLKIPQRIVGELKLLIIVVVRQICQ